MEMRRCGMTLVLALIMTALLLSAPGAAADTIVDLPIDFTPGMPLQATFEQGVKVYDDPSIHVEYYSERSSELSCTYYVADIKIATAAQLRTESAAGGEKGFTSRQRVPVHIMARRMNAAVALDGDYYGEHPGALVLRQGVIFRGVQETYHDLLLIDEDGDFHVILAGNRDTEEGYGNTFPSTPVTEEQLTRTEDGKKIINGFDRALHHPERRGGGGQSPLHRASPQDPVLEPGPADLPVPDGAAGIPHRGGGALRPERAGHDQAGAFSGRGADRVHVRRRRKRADRFPGA